MHSPLNNRRVTVIPRHVPEHSVPSNPVPPASPAGPQRTTPANLVSGSSEPARPAERSRSPQPRKLGFGAVLTGHVVASLAGLAIGYYVLCVLRPAEFNWWGLPVPQVCPIAPASAPPGTLDEQGNDVEQHERR